MNLIDRDKLIMHIADCRLSGSITQEEEELITYFLLNSPIVNNIPVKPPIGKERFIVEVAHHLRNHSFKNYEYAQYFAEDLWIVKDFLKGYFLGEDMRGEE